MVFGKLPVACLCLLVIFSVPAAAQHIKGPTLIGALPGEQFGRNLKLSADGNTLAVAAPFNSAQGEKKGRIVVYRYQGGPSGDSQWQVLGKELLAGETDFHFGEIMELSADGKKLVVASPFQTVTVYEFDGADWRKRGPAFALENRNDMVASLSINEDATTIAIVYKSLTRGGNFLAVRHYNGQAWVPHGKEIALGGGTYGNSICLAAGGDTIVFANYAKSTARYKRAGEISTYIKVNDDWQLQENPLTGNRNDAILGSGLAVSADGTRLVASSSSFSLTDAVAGWVETYEAHSGGWKKDQPTLRPERQNSSFGHSIALSSDGSVLAVSMPYNGYAKPGFVKVYRRSGSGWKEAATFTDTNGVETTFPANNSTGWCIDLSADGHTLAIGFPHNDEHGELSGKVVVYDLRKP